MRGDRVHIREEARFTLHLLNDPKTALKFAEENWQVQKEPADIRILLESALAAHVESARGWLKQTGKPWRARENAIKTEFGQYHISIRSPR
jgi:hypothetical protein